MKITVIILIILGRILSVPAQQLQIMNTCGGDATSGTTGASFSIGEPITLTATGSVNLLTQGFLQPEQAGWVVETVSLGDQKWTFDIFPNPVSDDLYLKAETGAPAALNIRLYDAAGQLVLTEHLTKGNTNLTLNVRNFAAGWYCLSLTDESGGITASSGIVKK